jgi:D-psicose/D-tagatose/L-ribulose 3-epimerase
MNAIGLFFTHWATEWSVDFVGVARRIAGLGFDVMEISLAEFTGLPNAEKHELKQVADDLGLTVTCLIGLSSDYDMASPDQSVRNRAVEYVKHLLDDCRLLGSPVFGGLNYCAWPASPPPGVTDKREFVDLAVDSVRKVMPIAEDYGIVYAVEVVNRFEQWLVNDAREGLAFCDAVGSPMCKVHLDTFHMNIEEDSFRDTILTCADRIGHFHLGEANRRHPGQGRLPWDEIFGALRETGYEGPIVMEPFVRPGGQVGRDIALWRDLSRGATDDDLDELARRALAFVRDKLVP